MKLDTKILERIRNNDPDLTVLSLNYANIDDNEAKTLADALKHNHIVTELYLALNSIADIGANALADALKDNHTVTALELSSNSIGDEGACALADTLRNNRTLTTLNLFANAIGVAGTNALIDALKDNGVLVALNLGGNIVDNNAKRVLGNGLSKSKNIVYAKPASDKLRLRYEENEATVKTLIEKMQDDPLKLTLDERQEIKERIPAILYVGELEYRLSNEQILEMFSGIGMKPTFGPATRKVNEVREAQRKAALEDPSQGI